MLTHITKNGRSYRNFIYNRKKGINYAIGMVFERDTRIGVSTAQHPYYFGYIMADN